MTKFTSRLFQSSAKGKGFIYYVALYTVCLFGALQKVYIVVSQPLLGLIFRLEHLRKLSGDTRSH